MLSKDETQVEEKEIVTQEHEDDEEDDVVDETAGAGGELKVDVKTVIIYILLQRGPRKRRKRRNPRRRRHNSQIPHELVCLKYSPMVSTRRERYSPTRMSACCSHFYAVTRSSTSCIQQCMEDYV
jgi:hypothetical protein